MEGPPRPSWAMPCSIETAQWMHARHVETTCAYTGAVSLPGIGLHDMYDVDQEDVRLGGMSRAGSLWVCVCLLACFGLEFSSPSLEDVRYADAVDAGYTLPAGAERISVHDFSTMDVRSTRYRYTLPEAEFARLLEETRADGRYSEHDQWAVPASWPDYSIFGEDAAAPSWWQPSGEVVLRRSQPAVLEGSGSDIGSGALMAFDQRTHTVFLWQWQWQWWVDNTAGP